MSRFNEPLDIMPPSAAADGAPSLDARPLSKAAATGFVCALLFFVPLVTQLLGLIFGAIGIYNTRGHRLRGRGMAIAALPISLLVGAAWVGLISFGVFAFQAIRASDGEVLATLKASGEEHARRVAALYDERLSAGFKQRLSREQFVQWAADMLTKHGQLQSARLDPKKPVRQLPGGRLEMNYVGDFINGRAALTIRYESLIADPIKIDGFSLDGVEPTAD